MKRKISIEKFEKILCENIVDIKIIKNKSFRDLTTFKIGGKVKCLIEIRSIDSLLNVLKYLKIYSMEYIILGQGSNLLVSDKVCKKIVLKILINELKVRKNKVFCGSGVTLFKLNHFLICKSLSGMEWSYGIPGSVGGAIKMNAGSFGGEIKDVVKTVFYTDGTKVFKKDVEELEFGYRKSFFTNNNFVILKVVLELKFGKKDEIEKKCFDFYDKRRLAQPYNLPSAGSVFKRPENNFAPVLIESCGLKGKKCGGAEISKKHCGFIVNTSHRAKFWQVMKLIKKEKKEVFEKFGIKLEEEIIIIK